MSTEIFDQHAEGGLEFVDGDIETDPYHRLWKSVLVSAISDAMQLESPLKYRRNEARDAIRWLVHGGADFEEVCVNAGIEHTVFKKAALELLEKRLGLNLLGTVIAQHVLPWA
jgi:hypothetical protein